MVQLEWQTVASEEFLDALDWYSQEAPEQVDRLMAEVIEAEQLIHQMPKAWHPIVNDIRSFRLNKFPYSLIYRDTSPLRVIAFMHQHRRPGYWLDRIN
jgi:plasmid stabilization system protein ParE